MGTNVYVSDLANAGGIINLSRSCKMKAVNHRIAAVGMPLNALKTKVMSPLANVPHSLAFKPVSGRGVKTPFRGFSYNTQHDSTLIPLITPYTHAYF